MVDVDSPRVSVVIATYNRAHLLPRALDSILAQTYRDFELVVADDGSTDNTAAVVADYRRANPQMRAITLAQNAGPGAARNTAIRECAGQYVAIMDDDDICVPTRLEKQLNALEADPTIDVCFGLVRWMDGPNQPGRIFPGALAHGRFPTDSQAVFRLLLLESNKIPNVTLFARRNALLRYPYAEDVRVGEDWYMLLHMARHGVRMCGIPEVLVYFERSAAHWHIARDGERRFADNLRMLARLADELKLPLALRRQALAKHHLRAARYWGLRRGFGNIVKSWLAWPLSVEPLAVLIHMAVITAGRWARE